MLLGQPLALVRMLREQPEALRDEARRGLDRGDEENEDHPERRISDRVLLRASAVAILVTRSSAGCARLSDRSRRRSTTRSAAPARDANGGRRSSVGMRRAKVSSNWRSRSRSSSGNPISRETTRTGSSQASSRAKSTAGLVFRSCHACARPLRRTNGSRAGRRSFGTKSLRTTALSTSWSGGSSSRKSPCPNSPPGVVDVDAERGGERLPVAGHRHHVLVARQRPEAVLGAPIQRRVIP